VERKDDSEKQAEAEIDALNDGGIWTEEGTLKREARSEARRSLPMALSNNVQHSRKQAKAETKCEQYSDKYVTSKQTDGQLQV
jgi:hypothetical protein